MVISVFDEILFSILCRGHGVKIGVKKGSKMANRPKNSNQNMKPHREVLRHDKFNGGIRF